MSIGPAVSPAVGCPSVALSDTASWIRLCSGIDVSGDADSTLPVPGIEAEIVLDVLGVGSTAPSVIAACSCLSPRVSVLGRTPFAACVGDCDGWGVVGFAAGSITECPC